MRSSNDRHPTLAALTRTVGVAVATAGLLFASAASVAASGAAETADHASPSTIAGPAGSSGGSPLLLVLGLAALVMAVLYATPRSTRRTVENDTD